VKAHPVSTSIKFTGLANSPTSVGPQRSTVSHSKTPGSSSTSLPAFRIVIEVRSSADGFVVEMSRSFLFRRARAGHQSIVAAGLLDSCLCTSGE